MEAFTDVLVAIGSWIPKGLFWLFKLSFFLLLSILVLPAMFIMLFLQAPWEKMLDEISAM